MGAYDNLEFNNYDGVRFLKTAGEVYAFIEVENIDEFDGEDSFIAHDEWDEATYFRIDRIVSFAYDCKREKYVLLLQLEEVG